LTDEDRLYIYESMNQAVDEGVMSKEEMALKWEELDKRTMTEEEYAAWQVDQVNLVKDVVVSPIMAALPAPMQQPTKDWTDDLVKYIILGMGGTTVLGGGAALAKSVKNSPPGRVFGPVRNNNKNATT
jgi:hypothetical protein